MLAGAPVTPRTSDAQRPAPGGATEVATAAGRGTPYVLGERRSLQSRVMGERRELIVFTPRSYSAGTGRYPVLYVLDGAENALIAATAARELAASSRVPEMIVVCVVNTDRVQDRANDRTHRSTRSGLAHHELAAPAAIGQVIPVDRKSVV